MRMFIIVIMSQTDRDLSDSKGNHLFRCTVFQSFKYKYNGQFFYAIIPNISVEHIPETPLLKIPKLFLSFISDSLYCL